MSHSAQSHMHLKVLLQDPIQITATWSHNSEINYTYHITKFEKIHSTPFLFYGNGSAQQR